MPSLATGISRMPDCEEALPGTTIPINAVSFSLLAVFPSYRPQSRLQPTRRVSLGGALTTSRVGGSQRIATNGGHAVNPAQNNELECREPHDKRRHQGRIGQDAARQMWNRPTTEWHIIQLNGTVSGEGAGVPLAKPIKTDEAHSNCEEMNEHGKKKFRISRRPTNNATVACASVYVFQTVIAMAIEYIGKVSIQRFEYMSKVECKNTFANYLGTLCRRPITYLDHDVIKFAPGLNHCNNRSATRVQILTSEIGGKIRSCRDLVA